MASTPSLGHPHTTMASTHFHYGIRTLSLTSEGGVTCKGARNKSSSNTEQAARDEFRSYISCYVKLLKSFHFISNEYVIHQPTFSLTYNRTLTFRKANIYHNKKFVLRILTYMFSGCRLIQQEQGLNRFCSRSAVLRLLVFAKGSVEDYMDALRSIFLVQFHLQALRLVVTTRHEHNQRIQSLCYKRILL